MSNQRLFKVLERTNPDLTPKLIEENPDFCPYAKQKFEGKFPLKGGGSVPRNFVSCKLLENLSGWPLLVAAEHCRICEQTSNGYYFQRKLERWLRIQIERQPIWDSFPEKRRPSFPDSLEITLNKFQDISGKTAGIKKLAEWDGDPDAFRDSKGRYMRREDWERKAGKEKAIHSLLMRVENGGSLDEAEDASRKLWPEEFENVENNSVENAGESQGKSGKTETK